MKIFIIIVAITYALSTDKDACYQKLLTNRTIVPDEAFSVSSYEIDYEAKYARDSLLIEKAWCPKNRVHNTLKEYISIDLGSIYILKMIMTKGLSRHGYKSASYYYIKYKIEGHQEWIRYRNVSEFKKIYGNKDHLTEKFNLFMPSIVTRWIRIYPISSQPEMICLNLQLYGCQYSNNIIEYQMIDGSMYFNSKKNTKDSQFTDQSYDGVLLHTRMLKAGLGKLTDNDYEKDDNNPFNMSTYPFIGWNRKDFPISHIQILFRFLNNRKFFNVHLRTANYRPELVALPKLIVITFSSDGINYDRQKSINHAIKADYKNFNTRWIMIDLEGRMGSFVSINIHFESQWIMIREILFASEPLQQTNYNDSMSTAIIIRTNSTIIKTNNKTNVITITDIFLSSSISLGILLILAICLICIIKWKRKTRIRKYKKAMHMQSQDEEYNRILTLQHQNLKNQTLYYPVANLSTLNSKYQTPEKKCPINRQLIIPEAYNYWFYNDFCLDTRSSVDVHSVYNDTSKYLTMEKGLQSDISHLDIRGPLGNSQMYRMNLINFISISNNKTSSAFHDIVNQSNISELKSIENISLNSYGRIDVVSITTSYNPYELDSAEGTEFSNIEGEYTNTVVCVRKMKPDCLNSIRQNFLQELDNLSQINHKNLITFVVVPEKGNLASYIVNEYTSLMDIFTLLQSLSILQTKKDSISIEQSHLLYVAVQLSDAMSYLEYLGLVHRDISCRNILVIDPYLFIKVCDLAIAQPRFRSQYWEVGKHHLNNQKTNEFVQLPFKIPMRWMSWEVIIKKEFSMKSDVYSFGVCMWELFNYCQQLPYETLSDYQIFMNKVLFTSNIQPHQTLRFPNSTAREIIDIIEQCLVDEAQQRPTFKEIHIFFSKKNSGYKSNDALVKELLVKYCCSTTENVPTIYFD